PPSSNWTHGYVDLPIYNDLPILLVPKAITRRSLTYDYKEYYRHHVLNFLQSEELNAGTSLVRTLKSGLKRVFKKDVEAKHPLSKDFLYDFSMKHPDVLKRYKSTKTQDVR